MTSIDHSSGRRRSFDCILGHTGFCTFLEYAVGIVLGICLALHVESEMFVKDLDFVKRSRSIRSFCGLLAPILP